MPDSLCDLLKEHRAKQNEKRLHAGPMWDDGDWAFASKTGAPLNARSDWGQWKKLLKDAGSPVHGVALDAQEPLVRSKMRRELS